MHLHIVDSKVAEQLYMSVAAVKFCFVWIFLLWFVIADIKNEAV